MYARIKHVGASELEAEVEGLLRDLDLVRFADHPCGTYSGGNKRKLCASRLAPSPPPNATLLGSLPPSPPDLRRPRRPRRVGHVHRLTFALMAPPALDDPRLPSSTGAWASRSSALRSSCCSTSPPQARAPASSHELPPPSHPLAHSREPYPGMDAASKRFLWSVIKRRTARSSVLLTTHSMEECEALCGRIGVMVEGTLCCLGPIQTLKNAYGQGYKLDLRLDTARDDVIADAESILALLQSRHDGAELLELEPPSMVLTVPREAAPQDAAPQAGQDGSEAPPPSSPKLSELFGLLDELKATHHVVEGSITQCTLEQIFIRMATKSKMRSKE